jgi:catechol 2,3-dioxygenase-like lactoylglutathione lyase family enzyme
MTLAQAGAEARLPVRDLERARRWYADKLGLDPTEERPGGLRYQTATGTFCLFVSQGAPTQLGFSVDDLRGEMAALRARASRLRTTTSPGCEPRAGRPRSRATIPARVQANSAPGFATARATY